MAVCVCIRMFVCVCESVPVCLCVAVDAPGNASDIFTIQTADFR